MPPFSSSLPSPPLTREEKREGHEGGRSTATVCSSHGRRRPRSGWTFVRSSVRSSWSWVGKAAVRGRRQPQPRHGSSSYLTSSYSRCARGRCACQRTRAAAIHVPDESGEGSAGPAGRRDEPEAVPSVGRRGPDLRAGRQVLHYGSQALAAAAGVQAPAGAAQPAGAQPPWLHPAPLISWPDGHC